MKKEEETLEESFFTKQWKLVKGDDLKWRVFCAFFYSLLIVGLKFISSIERF
jgi:hypothetical protein